MIIVTSRCVMYKNYVARSKVKVTVHTHSLCIGISCSAHNFILHGGIWKLFGINDHQAKIMCPVQEPCCYVKSQVHSSHLQFICIGLNETYSCLAYNFVVGPASEMVRYKDLVFHFFIRSHQGAILLKALGGASVSYGHISFLFEGFFSYFETCWEHKEDMCMAF